MKYYITSPKLNGTADFVIVDINYDVVNVIENVVDTKNSIILDVYKRPKKDTSLGINVTWNGEMLLVTVDEYYEDTNTNYLDDLNDLLDGNMPVFEIEIEEVIKSFSKLITSQDRTSVEIFTNYRRYNENSIHIKHTKGE